MFREISTKHTHTSTLFRTKSIYHLLLAGRNVIRPTCIFVCRRVCEAWFSDSIDTYYVVLPKRLSLSITNPIFKRRWALAMILTLRHLWAHSITRPYYQHVVIPARASHFAKMHVELRFWYLMFTELKLSNKERSFIHLWICCKYWYELYSIKKKLRIVDQNSKVTKCCTLVVWHPFQWFCRFYVFTFVFVLERLRPLCRLRSEIFIFCMEEEFIYSIAKMQGDNMTHASDIVNPATAKEVSFFWESWLYVTLSSPSPNFFNELVEHQQSST